MQHINEYNISTNATINECNNKVKETYPSWWPSLTKDRNSPFCVAQSIVHTAEEPILPINHKK